MEQIDQLKSMRDAAQVRLQANPDFKLKNSLDALIDDLEAFIATDGASGVESAVDVETQDELVASDDEEEQQSDIPVVIEPVIAIDEFVVAVDESVAAVESVVAVDESVVAVDESVVAVDESVVAVDEEVSGDLAYANVEQTDAAIGIEENSDESNEESEIVAAIAANISTEEIDGDGNINGLDFINTTQLDNTAQLDNTTQLDMEAEAAIEALEAELAQTDSDSNRPTTNSP